MVIVFISIILVSLISFSGIALLLFNKRIERFLPLLVSLSAGTLFGGAFFHLFPEAVEKGFSINTSIFALLGIVVFFLIDKLIHFGHRKREKAHTHVATAGIEKKSMAYLNLIGDGLHNFLDGLVIVASYMVNIPTGMATTLAVIIHELPQEMVDFGVLVYAGFSKKKALFFNFLSALASLLGAFVGIILNNQEWFLEFALPFTGGAFVYIAGSNLIPELLQREQSFSSFLIDFLFFIGGILVMYGLLFV